MLLQQEENSNGCPPGDQLVPGKYGPTCSPEYYYFHEWGNISNDWPQITSDSVRGGGGGRVEGARTDIVYGTWM